MDTRYCHCPRDPNLSCAFIVPHPLGAHDHVVLETLGASIAGLRRLRGISQERLAELSGVSRNTISLIETGKCDLRVVTLSEISSSLRSGCMTLDPITCAVRCEDDGAPFTSVPAPVVAEAIGEAVATLRQRLALSREILSDISGVHRNTISRIEWGLGEARITTLYRLYRSFGICKVLSGPCPVDPTGDSRQREAYLIPGQGVPDLHLLSRP